MTVWLFFVITPFGPDTQDSERQPFPFKSLKK